MIKIQDLVTNELLRRERPSVPSLSLHDFVRMAWRHFDPSEFRDNWHIGAICDHMQACATGQIDRLIINVPPGSSKTSITGVCFPAWLWTWDIGAKTMCSTYGAALAHKTSTLFQTLVESDWYRESWTNVIPSEKSWNKGMCANDKGGLRSSVSSGGGLGSHCHYQIVDDPHKKMLPGADLQAQIESDIAAYDGVLASRMISDKTHKGARMVIMQRLAERDLTGYLLNKFRSGEPGSYIHLMIPMHYETDRAFYTAVRRSGTDKQWSDPRVNEGELLDPSRRSIDECDARRRDLGEQGYSAQEQQRPAPATGALIKKSWIRYYDFLPDVASSYTIMSIDATFKGGPGSDYVAIEVWSKLGTDLYLIDMIHERMGFNETLAAGERMMRKWPSISEILVEDTANGPAIIDTWRQKFSGVIPVRPDGGKVARLNSVSYLFESGNVLIPSPNVAPWSVVFEDELTSFPLSPHDDMVDAASQALRRLGNARSMLLSGVVGIPRERGAMERQRHVYGIPGGRGTDVSIGSVQEALMRG
jgi:predicted phage terminase large subunit-like protein